MVSGISEEDVKQLILTDLSSHLSHCRTREPNSNILASVIETCREIVSATDDLSSSEQYSVAASLPAVSASSNAAAAAIQSTLIKLLSFASGEDVELRDSKNWSFVEDSLDGVFACLDDAIAASTNTVPLKSMLFKANKSDVVETRPQVAWKDLIDNFRPRFVSPIREKLHAIEPLSDIPEKNVYESEIRACLKHRCQLVGAMDTLIDVVEEFADTPLVFVDTEEGLDALIRAVVSAGEVAIDLEHHDIHSYRGFTCLIQLSTRTCDYIIDPFPLFSLLHKLNIFTTDPSILKVLHGADMDIQWLQRDFGVYVVNMFDTGQAARVIGLAGGFGLANLLDTFCRVKTNKKFQTSDWRLRPLPKDMLNYARLDTHYLLYIRDRLVNAVLSLGGAGFVSVYGKKMLVQVLEKSFGIASKVYRDAPTDYYEESVQLCVKSPALRVGSLRSSSPKMAALVALLEWRDVMARTLDESKHWVLSNSAALRLANSGAHTAAEVLRTLSYESNSYMAPMRIGADLAEELALAMSKQFTLPAAEPLRSEQKETRKISVGNLVVTRKSSIGKVSDFSVQFSNEESALSRILTCSPPPSVPPALLEEMQTWLTPILLEQCDVEAMKVDDTPLLEIPAIAKEEIPPTVMEQRSSEEPKLAKPPKKKSKNVASAAAKALEFVERELA